MPPPAALNDCGARARAPELRLRLLPPCWLLLGAAGEGGHAALGETLGVCWMTLSDPPSVPPVSPDCSVKFPRVTKFTLVQRSNEPKPTPTSLHLQ